MLRSEEIRSPLSTRAGSSLYDKLNLLAAEISEGVVNLSHGQRFEIENELRRLKDEANREVSPEAVYNLLLFRRYSEIANQIKEKNVELERSVIALNDASLFNVGTGTIDGQKEAKLAGFEAIKANLFWLRVLAALLSFISFIVMSFVPYVTQAHYSPKGHLLTGCSIYIADGTFNMRPFQFVIGAGVLIYIHTLVTSMYYLLPVDNDNQKYIPGFREMVSLWVNDEQQTEELMTTLGACVRTIVRFLEFVADFTLVVLTLVAFILAAIAVEQPTAFSLIYSSSYTSYIVTYYTMESFFLSFSHTSPQCISDDDPVPKIRASLAMLFFALVVMFICLQVSWRAAKQEFTHRTPPSGHTASDIGSRGVHTFEGREAFLAQALPTSEEEEEGGGGSDEEVAVQFHRTPPRQAAVHTSSVEMSSRAPSYTATDDADRIKGRGASYMRNHEAQRFATTTVTTPAGPTSDTVRDEELDRAVAALESADSYSESEAELEETDL